MTKYYLNTFYNFFPSAQPPRHSTNPIPITSVFRHLLVLPPIYIIRLYGPGPIQPPGTHSASARKEKPTCTLAASVNAYWFNLDFGEFCVSVICNDAQPSAKATKLRRHRNQRGRVLLLLRLLLANGPMD